MTSTTSVLPSQRPREAPSQRRTDASTRGGEPMGITRNVWLRECVRTNASCVCAIVMSPGVYSIRGTPDDRHDTFGSMYFSQFSFRCSSAQR